MFETHSLAKNQKNEALQQVNGIILAGGLSTRFSSCKSKIKIKEESLLERNYNLLQKYCDKVLVSCKENTMISPYPCLYDNAKKHAPIFGIYAALEHYKSAVMVISCDLPFISEKELSVLLEARNKAYLNENTYMTTFRKIGTDYIEALVAIYEYRCKDLLKNSIDNDFYALWRIIPEKLRNEIPSSNEEPFFNINYQDDLAYVEKTLEQFQKA